MKASAYWPAMLNERRFSVISALREQNSGIFARAEPLFKDQVINTLVAMKRGRPVFSND